MITQGLLSAAFYCGYLSQKRTTENEHLTRILANESAPPTTTRQPS